MTSTTKRLAVALATAAALGGCAAVKETTNRAIDAVTPTPTTVPATSDTTYNSTPSTVELKKDSNGVNRYPNNAIVPPANPNACAVMRSEATRLSRPDYTNRYGKIAIAAQINAAGAGLGQAARSAAYGNGEQAAKQAGAAAVGGAVGIATSVVTNLFMSSADKEQKEKDAENLANLQQDCRQVNAARTENTCGNLAQDAQRYDACVRKVTGRALGY